MGGGAVLKKLRGSRLKRGRPSSAGRTPPTLRPSVPLGPSRDALQTNNGGVGGGGGGWGCGVGGGWWRPGPGDAVGQLD